MVYAFDDLEKTPMALLKKIYDDFEFDHFEKAAPHFKTYIEKNKHYKKNTHYIKKSLLNDLQNKCGFVMEEYRYSIPIHLEVNDV